RDRSAVVTRSSPLWTTRSCPPGRTDHATRLRCDRKGRADATAMNHTRGASGFLSRQGTKELTRGFEFRSGVGGGRLELRRRRQHLARAVEQLLRAFVVAQ